MRTLLLLLTLGLFTNINAQYRNEIGGSIGSSNYLGDIGGSSGEGNQTSPVDLKLKAQRTSLNGYYRHKINRDLSLRTSFTYINLYGNDALTSNPSRNARNLSFKSNVYEISTTTEWNFFQVTNMTPLISDSVRRIKRRDLKTFIFAGVGVINFNSKAELLGKTYDLRPLKTEGVKYKPFTWVIPIGFGLSYTINKTWRFGTDMSYRITGSDWIDDVSGNYNVSYADGLNGYNAVKNGSTNQKDIRNALGNRTSEVQSYQAGANNYNPSLPLGANYDVTTKGGTPRGGNYVPNTSVSKKSRVPYKDGYVTFNISLGYVMKGKNYYYRERSRYVRSRRREIKFKTGARF